MCGIKKNIIFDIEQSYFLINKVNVEKVKSLFTMVCPYLFYFNQQNLITN